MTPEERRERSKLRSRAARAEGRWGSEESRLRKRIIDQARWRGETLSEAQVARRTAALSVFLHLVPLRIEDGLQKYQRYQRRHRNEISRRRQSRRAKDPAAARERERRSASGIQTDPKRHARRKQSQRDYHHRSREQLADGYLAKRLGGSKTLYPPALLDAYRHLLLINQTLKELNQ